MSAEYVVPADYIFRLTDAENRAERATQECDRLRADLARAREWMSLAKDRLVWLAEQDAELARLRRVVEAAPVAQRLMNRAYDALIAGEKFVMGDRMMLDLANAIGELDVALAALDQAGGGS